MMKRMNMDNKEEDIGGIVFELYRPFISTSLASGELACISTVRRKCSSTSLV